jgi:hypothetical protein
LGGDFVDILITKDGDKIVGMTRDSLLQTFEYPSLNLIDEMVLENIA